MMDIDGGMHCAIATRKMLSKLVDCRDIFYRKMLLEDPTRGG
jgi:hypothetical protein